MRNSIRRVLRFVNYVFVAGLLLAHAATELSPQRVWWLALFGMAYPFFLFGNVFFVGYWLWRKRITVLLSFTFLVLNYGYVYNYWPIRLEAASQQTGFKLLSYNVRMFDLYRWSGDKFTGSKTINFVLGEKPDVLFLQEYFSRSADSTSPTYRFTHELELTNYRSQHHPWKNRDNGLAIFARYPLLRHDFLRLDNRPYALWADMRMGNDTVRLVNVHLSSLHFDYEQYNFIDSIQYKDNLQKRNGALKIVFKLRHAFRQRALQVDSLLVFVRQSPFPVVLGGDFNDPPGSYAYYRLRHRLRDAHVDNLSGMGATYQRFGLPLRIDMLLYDSTLFSSTYQVHEVDFSDHRPISAYFGLQDSVSLK